ncbi:MAG: hypothetical protein OXE49_15115 [Gemmatimonadetes bacterium]|nr:hypothetical protein [Gemmatimonadota bacterium]
MGIVAPDVVHPTTVHSLFDNRIFHRDFVSLSTSFAPPNNPKRA